MLFEATVFVVIIIAAIRNQYTNPKESSRAHGVLCLANKLSQVYKDLEMPIVGDKELLCSSPLGWLIFVPIMFLWFQEGESLSNWLNQRVNIFIVYEVTHKIQGEEEDANVWMHKNQICPETQEAG